MSSLKKQPILNSKPLWRSSSSEYITAIAWSPDGKALAAATAAGEVTLFPEANSTNKKSVILRSQTDASIDCLEFSANGKWLVASGQNGKIDVWKITQDISDLLAKPTLSLDQGNAWIDKLAWHPIRSEFAFSLGKYVQVWSAETQDIITTINFDASSVLALSWHPSGDWLTVGGYQGIKVWSAADWDEDPVHFISGTATDVMTWDCSGKYLAANTLEKSLMLLQWLGNDFDTSPWHMQGFPGKVRACTWSMLDDEPILVTSSSSEMVVWRMETTPQINWYGETLTGHLDNVNLLAFPLDRALLASAAADGKVSLWQNANICEQTIEASKSSEITSLQWQPHGQRLAAGTANGEVLVWSEFTQPKGFGIR